MYNAVAIITGIIKKLTTSTSVDTKAESKGNTLFLNINVDPKKVDIEVKNDCLTYPEEDEKESSSDLELNRELQNGDLADDDYYIKLVTKMCGDKNNGSIVYYGGEQINVDI